MNGCNLMQTGKGGLVLTAMALVIVCLFPLLISASEAHLDINNLQSLGNIIGNSVKSACPFASTHSYTPMSKIEEPLISGTILDCSCSANVVESLNQKILPVLDELVQTPFFRYYKLNLWRKCSLFPDDGQCASRSCSIDECAEDEFMQVCVDPNLETSSTEGKVDSTLDTESFDSWKEEDSDPWTNDADSLNINANMNYFDLSKNPERYTGYTGPTAWRIWDAIYRENCFLDHAENEPLPNMDVQNTGFGANLDSQCVEKRVFYRIISGLHASISTHLAHDYANDFSSGQYSTNASQFYLRVGKHQQRVHNMYLTYLMLLRATSKIMPYLQQYEYNTINVKESKDIKSLISQLASVTTTCPDTFDENTMFKGKDALLLKKQFRNHFKNISVILDCVSCERCKLWGKLQINGIGTALKILFDSKQHSGDPSFKIDLQRTEIVAMIHTFRRLGESLTWATEMHNLHMHEIHQHHPSSAPHPREQHSYNQYDTSYTSSRPSKGSSEDVENNQQNNHNNAHILPVQDEGDARILPIDQKGDNDEVHILPVYGLEGDDDPREREYQIGEDGEMHILPIKQDQVHSLPIKQPKKNDDVHTLPVQDDDVQTLPIEQDEVHILPVYGLEGDDDPRKRKYQIGEDGEIHILPVKHEVHSLPVKHQEESEIHTLPVEQEESHYPPIDPEYSKQRRSKGGQMDEQNNGNEATILPPDHEAHTLPVEDGLRRLPIDDPIYPDMATITTHDHSAEEQQHESIIDVPTLKPIEEYLKNNNDHHDQQTQREPVPEPPVHPAILAKQQYDDEIMMTPPPHFHAPSHDQIPPSQHHNHQHEHQHPHGHHHHHHDDHHHHEQDGTETNTTPEHLIEPPIPQHQQPQQRTTDHHQNAHHDDHHHDDHHHHHQQFTERSSHQDSHHDHHHDHHHGHDHGMHGMQGMFGMPGMGMNDYGMGGHGHGGGHSHGGHSAPTRDLSVSAHEAEMPNLEEFSQWDLFLMQLRAFWIALKETAYETQHKLLPILRNNQSLYSSSAVLLPVVIIFIIAICRRAESVDAFATPTMSAPAPQSSKKNKARRSSHPVQDPNSIEATASQFSNPQHHVAPANASGAPTRRDRKPSGPPNILPPSASPPVSSAPLTSSKPKKDQLPPPLNRSDDTDSDEDQEAPKDQPTAVSRDQKQQISTQTPQPITLATGVAKFPAFNPGMPKTQARAPPQRRTTPFPPKP